VPEGGPGGGLVLLAADISKSTHLRMLNIYNIILSHQKDKSFLGTRKINGFLTSPLGHVGDSLPVLLHPLYAFGLDYVLLLAGVVRIEGCSFIAERNQVFLECFEGIELVTHDML
jgi:hypothetical protein